MSPRLVIDYFYQQIINKDADAIVQSYYPSDELYVVLEGPRLTNRGINNIRQGWIDFCDSGLSLSSISWQEGPFVEESPEMAWVAGVIHLAVLIDEKSFTQTFRATFVLVKYKAEWKIKHEHVSAALADPYGIGDWLKLNNND